MAYRIQARDMFWFAVFHIGAIVCVALFSGCAGVPSMFQRKDGVEAQADRKTRLQLQLGQARSYEQQRESEKAREVYERLVVEYPDHVEPFHRLAVLKDKAKEHIDAQRLYARALQLDPHNAQLVNDFGYSYFMSGDLPAARRLLEQAVAMEPANSLYRNNLGMTLGHLGMYKESLDRFVEAGGLADGYYNLAFVYSTQSKFEEAKECFRRALEVNPRHEQSRVALEGFRRYERNPELANEMMVAGDANGYWQPYKENSGGAVAQASHVEQPSDNSAPPTTDADSAFSDSASSAGNQMQARAAAMLQSKMARFRGNAAENNAPAYDAFEGGY